MYYLRKRFKAVDGGLTYPRAPEYSFLEAHS